MAASHNKFTFAGGEVTVSIPANLTPALKAVSLDIGAVDMQPSSGFRPIRTVANIAIEQVGNPGVYLTDLPAAVHFKVKYRDADKQIAGGKPLVLAFWDGAKWLPLSGAKHGLKLTAYADSKKGGYGNFSITKWGDPPISWGT